MPDLPAVRHVPGTGTVPDRAWLEAAKAGYPDHFTANAWAATPPFLKGADCYNHGFFWEAHELWEPVWLAAAPNSAERTALKALIQTANAFLKLSEGQTTAFARLTGEAQALLGEPGVARIDLGFDLLAFGDALGAADQSGGIDARPAINLRQGRAR